MAAMMRAAFVTEFGKPFTVGGLPVPEHKDEQVLTKIEGCGKVIRTRSKSAATPQGRGSCAWCPSWCPFCPRGESPDLASLVADDVPPPFVHDGHG